MMYGFGCDVCKIYPQVRFPLMPHVLPDNFFVSLSSSNREVKALFIDLVKDWFQKTTLADSAGIKQFCAAFPAGGVKADQRAEVCRKT